MTLLAEPKILVRSRDSVVLARLGPDGHSLNFAASGLGGWSVLGLVPGNIRQV